ncbi:MAG: hypothetical protein ACJ79A_17875 [Gemmatimonadaceae bacterium]
MPSSRRVWRIWWRAGIVCGLYFLIAVASPHIWSALDPQSERRAIARSVERAQRETAPVFVMPNGERRRAVAVARADPAPSAFLFWWCGILAAVTIAGAAAQTVRLYRTGDEADS